jgi:hypothetical protein
MRDRKDGDDEEELGDGHFGGEFEMMKIWALESWTMGGGKLGRWQVG